MKIKFSKFRLYLHLVLGLLWMVLGLYYVYLNTNNINLPGYFYLIAGVFFLGQFIYDKRNQYLIIENGTITKNILYSFSLNNKIDLDKIQEIRKVKGNYILKSETEKLKINLDLIDNPSLNKLMDILRDLNLPSDKSFLAN